MKKPSVLVIIPARGGSKGIPRKNIRLLNDKPLISYTINAARESMNVSKVVVSTDDFEISNVAQRFGAEVIMRPEHLASDDVPLDPVIYDVITDLEYKGEHYDYIATIQPTSPLLRSSTIEKVIRAIINSKYDTILTAVDDRHLAWTKSDNKFSPLYKERKNRQYLPSEYKETGAILISKREAVTTETRFGKLVTLFEMDKYESVDIDSPMDWWIAEKLLNRKKVVIRVDGYEQIGLGHIYRTLTLANQIMDHELIFLMDKKYQLGIDLVENQNFKIVTFEKDPIITLGELKPDIIINDILDTSREYVLSLKELGIKVFNFEDLGEGAEYADGVFNALYPGSVPADSFYTGDRYYCARPDFMDIQPKELANKVDNVLLTFGGTDPNNLTLKVLESIDKSSYDFSINIILGPGYSHVEKLYERLKDLSREVKVYNKVTNMADFMLGADIIFSSAGRTMYEIAMVGTPAIIIAQNYRELTHLFGHNYNGFLNLGIHSEISNSTVLSSFERLYEDFELRKRMNSRMKKHSLKDGIERIFNIILGN